MSKAGALARLASGLVVLAASAAGATDPLNSSDKPTNTDATSTPKDEVNLVPLVGGSTDIGIGGGFFAGLARVQKGYEPYVFNLEASGLITFKSSSSGLVLPVQDLWVKLTVPRLFGQPVRLAVRPSYTWEVLRYYGLGNGAVDATRSGASTDEVSYRRLHPQLDTELRFRILDHFAGFGGARFTYNAVQTTADSALVRDQQTGSDEVKKLLGSFDSHAVLLLKAGVQFDNRDNELSSHSGSFDELNLKYSPGGSAAFPYRYGNFNLIARGFLPIWGSRVVLAARLVADVLVGDPPFYELSRFEDTYAVGGGGGVRGVPAQRYYGKVKTFGNAELRTELVSFHALGKPLLFGLVGFFDGGRVWADTHAEPTLDSTGTPLKYGAGGGLRLQSGSAFVLRADIAWSPDASPISGYFSAGQLF